MSSTAFFIYVASVAPQIENFMDKVDFFNETCTILMSYYVIMFSGFTSDPYLKYEMGWHTIYLFVLNFMLNVGIIIYQTVKMMA
jgi:hypothetical protein